ncbi:MAG TPA: hypothetical protein VFV22_01375, partial [Candidatus Paceibacterota bacterium]|nr:hypothetical protein [Candidatus Paceibacterota bacterium]
GPVTITATPRIVPIGKDTTLTWNLNGNDSSTCTLTGGTLNITGTDLDDGTETVTVRARTKYTLSCTSGYTGFVYVDIVPTGYET